jgi:type VI secretion system secreted protein VgrG
MFRFHPESHLASSERQLIQQGAVMKVDSIDRWRSETRWATNAIDMSSWDYRAVNHRPVSAAGSGEAPTLTSRDTPGAYAYQTREQGQRIADNQLQALEAARQMHVAAGTVRTLSPGTTFTLHGQAQFDLAANDDARTFVVVRAVHLMHNNLSADLLGGVIKLLGQGAVAAAGDKEFKLHAIVGAKDIALHAVGTQMGQRPMYRNRLDVLLNSVPYRSSGRDGHGHLLHPRPTVAGQQTAIVVGPPGAVIHTDRDHRIKVQFHWQRGAASHSRLDHPAADSHTGAPGDDIAGTWVRSMKDLAGPAQSRSASPLLPQANPSPSRATQFGNRFDVCSLFDSSELLAGVSYKVERADGNIHHGVLDANGRTERLYGEDQEDVKVLLGDGDWEIDIAELHDTNCGCANGHERHETIDEK